MEKAICFLFLAIALPSIAQKAFEGRVVSNITYENVPETYRAFVSSSRVVSYFKGNKCRIEVESSSSVAPFTNITIMDFDKGEQLSLMEMKLTNTKTATISKITVEKNIPVTGTEHKEILGYDCIKTTQMTTSDDGKVLNNVFYVNKDYMVPSGMGENGKVQYMGLPLLSTVEVPSFGLVVNKSEKVILDPVDKSVFDFTIPTGYTITDNRSGAPTSQATTDTEQETYDPKDPYKGVSDEKLRFLLDAAVGNEDFDAAAELKAELDKRGANESNKYKAYSDDQLKKMQLEAVKLEDFSTAEEIKEELDKRNKK